MIYILLPAFNEEKSLPLLIPKINTTLRGLNADYRFLICDDGSSDGTDTVLKKLSGDYPIEVIRHKLNRGLGETSRDLFERATELSGPEDIIIRMDCDNTHEPAAIPEMLARIKAGFDVVIASRFQPGGGQVGLSAYKALISYCANIFMKIFFPIRGVREYSCGFRAYRARIIQEAISTFQNQFIQLKGIGFTCTLEKLVKLRMLGARFCEVPFLLRYDQKKSKSKMVGSVTMFGYLTLLIFYYWPWGGWKSGYKKITREDAHR